MAALISIYSGYVALSFLPPLVWLLFYLHEDRHPEPKHLLLLTFIAGIISALAAVALEVGLFGRPMPEASWLPCGLFCQFYPSALAILVFVLAGVALVEEYVKYLAVKFAVLSRPDFDEPVDAMIYMVTAALGFAAIENVLFLIPALEQSIPVGIALTANRFLGANLLHVLASAIVGYFLARHFFSPWRKHAVAAGILLATALHTLFNYFILNRDAIPRSLLLVALLLSLAAAVVFVEFERLKGSARESKPQA